MEARKGLTIDMIIARFVPILGALLFITGLGYLIYTSVWESLGQTVRLGLGFFASLMIIGGASSFSEKLKYFADVVMGSGILLLYGTLIYGSRTTDIAIEAKIPEIATIVTAFIFTLAVAYFASLRKSKVILALGILGAYITPFVIGQNDVWASNISYNTYLIYFAAVNGVIFLLGRELAIHDLIPLNLGGLFFGTYTLHRLIYSDHIADTSSGFFQSSEFTLILLSILVIMSIGSIALSSRYFSAKDEGWLSAGYLVPLLWFMFHRELLGDIGYLIIAISYIFIGIGYFMGWGYLRPLESTRYQHIASYAGGIIALVFAINSFFPEFSLYARILIAYIGLIFALLYTFQGNKGERLLAAILLTCFGAILSIISIYEYSETLYPTIYALFSLVPAIVVAPLVKIQGKTPESMVKFVNTYSIVAVIIAGIILVIKLLKDIDFAFAFFVLPGFLLVLRAYFQDTKNTTRASLMRIGVIWTSLGFFMSFIYFVSNFMPHVADDEHFWKYGGIFTNWHFIKGVFALMTYFLALSVSRDIQREYTEDRPSFLLVIIGYTTLLLMVNFMIITFCNDLGVEFTIGGPRAIGTTIWWIVLSISMLMIGIHYGHEYRSEKLLGLLLLLLTIAKIAIYDLSAMEMNKKIIVLMVVGGLIMLFSYYLQIQGYLKDPEKK